MEKCSGTAVSSFTLSQISPSAVHAGTRLANNPHHTPRWTKETERTYKCCIPGCNEAVLVQSKIASTEQIRSIVGYSVLQDLPVPTPLCKPHYTISFMTHCNQSKHTVSHVARPCEPHLQGFCPDQQRIQQYVTDKTGYEGEIPEGSKVCFTCYKSHLLMFKDAKTISTDADLSQLLNSLKLSLAAIHTVKNIDTLNHQCL